MKKGFDNDKYLQMQSEHIRERIAQFDNKLYLEFGGAGNQTQSVVFGFKVFFFDNVFRFACGLHPEPDTGAGGLWFF